MPTHPTHGQCERNPECVRGFKHGGKGGRCGFSTVAESPEGNEIEDSEEGAPGSRSSGRQRKAPDRLPPTMDPRVKPLWLKRQQAKEHREEAEAKEEEQEDEDEDAEDEDEDAEDEDAEDEDEGEEDEGGEQEGEEASASASWVGQAVDVPVSEFGVAGRGTYSGFVTKIRGGHHVQVYFELDGESYWYTRRAVAPWLRHPHAVGLDPERDDVLTLPIVDDA